MGVQRNVIHQEYTKIAVNELRKGMCIDISSICMKYTGTQTMQVAVEMLLVIFILNNSITSAWDFQAFNNLSITVGTNGQEIEIRDQLKNSKFI